MMLDEIKSELTDHIIPFWNNLRDDEFGGWYGEVDSALNVNKKSDSPLAHIVVLLQRVYGA